ncbi:MULTISPECIES: NAD(P)-dependent oxidoreductase [unclassified Jeotgalibaca]|uniref:NAD(P)-dependent oxidoreductase n=1 Tax=unclassified Jeotgalibaca TaxID=2621505 RepID=UPI003FD0C4B3
MPNILITKPLKEKHHTFIQECLPDYEILTEPEEGKLAETEIIIHWPQTINTLWKEGKFPKLKWVQAISAGINYLPVAELQEKGIIITNASGIHKYTITEYVMGALLYYLRDYEQLKQNQHENRWSLDVRVEQLHEKTMMIFGIGNIGRQLATVAKAFGMTVIGVNTSGRTVSEVDETLAQEASKSRLKEADIIVSILPQTPETIHFFNKEIFEQMKPGTLFVNVGRGSSVDAEALVEALENDTLAFAALDVFEQEPLEADSPLWQHDKILISPHNSGTVAHFRDALFTIIGPNMEAYALNGKPSLNVIDYGKSY